MFERRWRLLELLLPGPRSREWLVDALLQHADAPDGEAPGLSKASLSADVAALRRLGVGFAPLGPEAKRSRQPYALADEHLPIWATREDARALRAAAEVLKGLNLPEAARLDGLYARVPAAVREGLREAYADGLLAASTTPHQAEVVRELQRAVAAAAPMWIGYQAVGKAARRYYVDRAFLTWQEGGLYLAAYCPKEPGATKVQRNREFRLDRFTPVEGHPAVEVLSGVRVAESVLPTFELRLWVAPSFAPRFRAVRGHQWVAPADDGAVIVRTRETNALRAVRRVLSYGDLVRVLAPDFVKTELRAVLGRMAAALDEA